MTMTATTAAVAAPAPGGARERTLIDRYHHLLTLPDAELLDALAAMIRAEQALPESEFHTLVFARLRAWLALDREDARIVARAFEQAMERFSDEQRERRYAAERSAILNGLRFSEFRALCGIVPWLHSEESLQLLFPEITEDPERVLEAEQPASPASITQVDRWDDDPSDPGPLPRAA